MHWILTDEPLVCSQNMNQFQLLLNKLSLFFFSIVEGDQFLTWSLLSSVGGATRGARADALSQEAHRRLHLVVIPT